MAANVVTIDETGVRRRLASGGLESVEWRDLAQVAIITTSDGPWSEDAFFVLGGAGGGGVVVPNEAAGPLLERLSKLPRFDFGKVIEAMGSCGDATFLCWRGDPGEGAAAACPNTGAPKT